MPIFNATAVEKLLNAGAVITNKTVLDEFGLGGTGTTGHILDDPVVKISFVEKLSFTPKVN